MVVSELIEILKRTDQEAVIELNVHGHVYNSLNDRRSHGPITVIKRGGVVQLRRDWREGLPGDLLLASDPSGV